MLNCCPVAAATRDLNNYHQLGNLETHSMGQHALPGSETLGGGHHALLVQARVARH
jgi:hypothetical protein